MAKTQEKDKRATVVAELTVTSSEGVETLKSFDNAWHRALELPKPVEVRFTGFVRKD